MALWGLVLVVTLGPAPAAFAHDVGDAPDASGNYAYCAWDSTARVSNQINKLHASCQYGPTTDTVVSVSASITMNGTTSNINGWFGTQTPPGATTVNAGGLMQGNYDAAEANVTINTSSMNSCTIKLSSAPTTARQASCTLTHTGGQPPYPAHWFTGGGDGNPTSDVALPVLVCTRTLEMEPTTAARFLAGITADANAADTFAWDFDDTGSSALKNPVHPYGLASQPEGGWTATVTVTRNPNAGHAFTNGSTADAEDECSLRVDFYNPSQSEPAGTGEDAGQDDSDCPSGWGWLNPAAIGTILRCLFIPTGFGEDWDTLMSTVTSTYPFGPVAFAVGAIADVWGGVGEGVAYAENVWENVGVNCDAMEQVTIGVEPVTEAPIDVKLFPSCDPEDGSFLSSAMTWTRLLSGIAFAVIGLLICLRLGAWMLGTSSPFGGGGGGDEE